MIRTSPDNAVDIVAGAISFPQIEQVWTFAKAQSNGGVVAALRREVARLVSTVTRLGVEDRRIDLGGAAIGFKGPSYARRLAIIVEMAEKIDRIEFAELIAPMMVLLGEEARRGQTNISDGVALLRALDAARPLPATEVADLRRQVQDLILLEARTGCSADELRELLGVLDTSERAAPVVLAAQESFAHFEQYYFDDELRACRSDEHFDGLIESLELFHDQLDVNVESLVERVEEARAEFDKDAEEYDDHMQDEWKERAYEDRHADSSISELFASLRYDRN